MAVDVCQLSANFVQIDKPINRLQHVILRNLIFQLELVEQNRLSFLLGSHQRQSSSSLSELNPRLTRRSSSSFSTKQSPAVFRCRSKAQSAAVRFSRGDDRFVLETGFHVMNPKSSKVSQASTAVTTLASTQALRVDLRFGCRSSFSR